MKNHKPCDALIVVPPFSPSDTNPPLGPYLLKACAERAGLALSVEDMSMRYIRRFMPHDAGEAGRLLGDQDKDRKVVHAARDHLRAICPLASEPTLHLPVGADPFSGMHDGFDAIERAVRAACEPGSPVLQLIEEDLFAHHREPPRVLGLSIMGPPQVYLALVIARLCKRRWPGVHIVAGGSHVTLLAHEIASDPRYGGGIDVFMPGHCEDTFVRLLRHVADTGSLPSGVGIRAGAGLPSNDNAPRLPTLNGKPLSSCPEFEYEPGFDRDALGIYDPRRVTIPMQLTRGCVYGKCTYCTYPAVETDADKAPDWPRAIGAIASLVERTGIRRFSFKDSLFSTKNLRELARRLKESRLNIAWSATTLLNKSLSIGVLNELYRGGCRTLEFGLETIDPLGQRLFGKELDLTMCERVIADATDAGIAVVINQILGWPGQTFDSACKQLDWYESIRIRCPERIHASFNMLEINRASPMASRPQDFGIKLGGVAPWAFSYAWNAPQWTREFRIGSIHQYAM